jgi:very-short-patch-repair endonuclease
MTKKRIETPVEDLMFEQISIAEIVPPIREYKFLTDRRFRFDFAFPQLMFAIEVEGGIFTRGRHINPMGFTKDCEKYALALINGWKVLRVTSGQVRNKEAIGWIIQYLNRNDIKHVESTSTEGLYRGCL